MFFINLVIAGKKLSSRWGRLLRGALTDMDVGSEPPWMDLRRPYQ